MAQPLKRDRTEMKMIEKDRQALNASITIVPLLQDSDTAAKMNALDSRVSAYLSLKSLSAARRDAVLMLRTDKNDGRGYVRCGQVERLAGDLDAAAQWYEHGLRRVPESNRLHPYIKEQLRKVTVTNRPRDPVALLPAEILEIILAHLKYRDIIRFLRVSRRWAEALSIIRPVADTIDFRIATKMISALSVNAALKRVGKSGKILHFANLSEPAEAFLQSRLADFREYSKLQTLSLLSMGFELWTLPFSKYPLREIQLGDSLGVEMATVVRILKTCKSLVSGKFNNVLVPGAHYPDVVSVQDFKPGAPISTVLEVLHLHCQAGPRGHIDLQASHTFHTNSNFAKMEQQSVLPCFPSLTEVECSYTTLLGGQIPCDLSSLRSLRKLRFHNVLCFFPKLPPSLEAWGNTSCSYSRPGNFNDEQSGPDYHHLTNLRILGMAQCSGQFLLSQFLPRSGVSKLTHLDCTSAGPVKLPLDRLANLQVLRVGGNTSKGNVSLFPQLRRLEEVHMTSSAVTNAQVADLIRFSGPCLQYIQCNDCPHVTPDAIKLAETKGITMVLND